MSAPLVVSNLSVTYPDGSHGLRGVDLEVAPGSCLALVGESGSGKSTLIGAALGLLPARTTVTGSVTVAGRDLLRLPERQRCRLRGGAVGYVPQDPFTALDPLRSVAHHVRSAGRAHGLHLSAQDVAGRLEHLGIDPAHARRRAWPHQWSGGMLQRACIAAATVCDPPLVLTDEPTSALDPDAAALVLRVLRQGAAALLLVTHDLAAAALVADEVAVLYAGRVVERGPPAEVLGAPRHPYTAALLAATPRRSRLVPETLPGEAPDPRAPLVGCLFRWRCGHADTRCETEVPVGPVACHHPL